MAFLSTKSKRRLLAWAQRWPTWVVRAGRIYQLSGTKKPLTMTRMIQCHLHRATPTLEIPAIRIPTCLAPTHRLPWTVASAAIPSRISTAIPKTGITGNLPDPFIRRLLIHSCFSNLLFNLNIIFLFTEMRGDFKKAPFCMNKTQSTD